mgnify:CR=1 FL=1
MISAKPWLTCVFNLGWSRRRPGTGAGVRPGAPDNFFFSNILAIVRQRRRCVWRRRRLVRRIKLKLINLLALVWRRTDVRRLNLYSGTYWQLSGTAGHRRRRLARRTKKSCQHTGKCPALPAPASGVAGQSFVSNILAIVRRKFAGVRRRCLPRCKWEFLKYTTVCRLLHPCG